jgi:hypothetical protein
LRAPARIAPTRPSDRDASLAGAATMRWYGRAVPVSSSAGKFAGCELKQKQQSPSDLEETSDRSPTLTDLSPLARAVFLAAILHPRAGRVPRRWPVSSFPNRIVLCIGKPTPLLPHSAPQRATVRTCRGFSVRWAFRAAIPTSPVHCDATSEQDSDQRNRPE